MALECEGRPSAARHSRAVATARDTIVHVHGWAKALSPSIGPVLKRAKLTCVFTMHEYFIACPNGGFYDYPAAHPCHLRPMSLACIARNCDQRSYHRKLMRVGRHAVMQHSGLLDCIGHVITLSRLQRQILQPYLPADVQYHQLANPIDVPPLGQKPDPARGDFVFVGRLSAEKGADVVCRGSAGRRGAGGLCRGWAAKRRTEGALP